MWATISIFYAINIGNELAVLNPFNTDTPLNDSKTTWLVDIHECNIVLNGWSDETRIHRDDLLFFLFCYKLRF